ncbi:Topoisomerase 1-associated factor 1 [Thoreauomyces humboldtii]|nr:Topoisomerase 1-associated factor 1 [Thoreauomyces humboldtii]
MDDEDGTIFHNNSHLLSICAALGGFENVEVDEQGQVVDEAEDVQAAGQPERKTSFKKMYIMGDETLACLRDLKRLLRSDEQSAERNVVRALGRWRIVQTDLIPILLLTHAAGQDKIAQAVLQLFVPLTWPVDKTSRDSAGQQEIQRGYKEAFLQEGVLTAVLEQLLKPLSIHHRERSDRDHAFIGLILTLFRNLLAIKDLQSTITATNEKYSSATRQEDLVICFAKTNITGLLTAFAGSLEEREYADWNLTIMEIFYYLFLNRDPEEMLAGPKKSSAELTALLMEEAGRKRMAARITNSRHARFGGTLALKLQDGQSFTVHNPSSALNSIEDSLDQGKVAQGGIRKAKNEDEYQKFRSIKDPRANAVYVEVATEFVEHCFNGMVASIRRDFAAEKDKVQEEHYARFMWLCAFMLKFQRCALRNHAKKSAEGVSLEEAGTLLDFDTVTGFLDLRGLSFVTGRIGRSQDEKRPDEVHVAVDCLKQMLLSLDAMMLSDDEDFRDASEHMQSNMYYEHSTIEIAVGLARDFKRQTHISHLKAVIEVIHVLLKMLEEYSTKKNVVFRRKKAHARKKKKPTVDSAETTRDGDESDHGDLEEDAMAPAAAVKEVALTFNKIVARFASDSIVSTYCLLLRHYQELESRYIYYIASMFHRLFVKCTNGAPLFYKLTTLQLFNKLITDKRTLPNDSAHKELFGFITYALSKFFKKAAEYSMLYVEVLFTKSRSDCVRIEFKNDEVAVQSAAMDDGEREIEVKPGLSWTEELKIVVTLLMERGDEEHLDWINDTLLDAATLRTPRPPLDDPDEEDERAPEVFDPYDLVGTTAGRRAALNKNAAVRLLLRLLSFEEVHEAVLDRSFRLAPSITSVVLLGHRDTVMKYMEDGGLDDGQKAASLVRKKRKKAVRKNIGEPRKTKEQVVQEFRSAAYIDDSDEDPEADAAFFAAERAMREKLNELHGAPDVDIAGASKPKPKPKAKAAKRTPTKPRKKKPASQEIVDTVISDSQSDHGGAQAESEEEVDEAGEKPVNEVDLLPMTPDRRPPRSVTRRRRALAVSDEGEDDKMEEDLPASPIEIAHVAPAAEPVTALDLAATSEKSTARRRVFAFSDDDELEDQNTPKQPMVSTKDSLAETGSSATNEKLHESDRPVFKRAPVTYGRKLDGAQPQLNRSETEAEVPDKNADDPMDQDKPSDDLAPQAQASSSQPATTRRRRPLQMSDSDDDDDENVAPEVVASGKPAASTASALSSPASQARSKRRRVLLASDSE